MPDPGRVLAIDYGDKRIGLAISDPTRTIASPAGCIIRRAGKRPPIAEIVRRAISAPTDRVLREVRRVTGAADVFPIDEYDELTAAQIVSRLGELPLDELRRVRDYERRNANRKTVLAALDAKLA